MGQDIRIDFLQLLRAYDQCLETQVAVNINTCKGTFIFKPVANNTKAIFVERIG